MENALIIKLGYSETLEDGISQDVSFGDVLRTTFILRFFENYHVTWLTDKKAFPLLKDNKYISRVLLWGPEVVENLKGKFFDTVINFEKLKEVYLLVDSLKYKKLFGFSSAILYDKQRHSLKHRKLFKLSQSIESRRKNKDCWQKILVEIIGKKWEEQKYVLGYHPKSKEKYDLGFNWTTSRRWTNKAWPKRYWSRLEELIQGKYFISWQKGLSNLYDYMDWINSCRLIVTADTLGLHLALALEKSVIALFGPTSPHEIYFYDCGTYLLPEFPLSLKIEKNCMPCFKPSCRRGKLCIEHILPERVKKKIDEEFKKSKNSG